MPHSYNIIKHLQFKFLTLEAQESGGSLQLDIPLPKVVVNRFQKCMPLCFWLNLCLILRIFNPCCSYHLCGMCVIYNSLKYHAQVAIVLINTTGRQMF